MKTLTFLIALFCAVPWPTPAQESQGRPHMPLLVSIQFHSLSVPFRNLTSNLRNIGVAIGTEFSYNNRGTLAQQVQVGWWRNRHTGNGLMVSTQPLVRGYFSDDAFAMVKVGVGYLLVKRPVISYRQKDGQWKAEGRRGKGMLALASGLSAGHKDLSITYQGMLVLGYNSSIPAVPQTLLQLTHRSNLNR